MSKVDTILDEIKGLTLLEASELVKKMEETFGVSAAATTVVSAGGGGGLLPRPRSYLLQLCLLSQGICA